MWGWFPWLCAQNLTRYCFPSRGRGEGSCSTGKPWAGAGVGGRIWGWSWLCPDLVVG